MASRRNSLPREHEEDKLAMKTMKPKKYRAIRFPTGVVAYLDDNDVLKGSPPEVIAGLSRRENDGELNAFEVFVKNFTAAF